LERIVKPPPKRNDRPASDEKITDPKAFHKLANGLGLDAEGEAWWAENAPDVETGKYYSVDGKENVARQQRAYERRQRAQCAWLIDNDRLAGAALIEALQVRERYKQEDRRRELMDREDREDLRQERMAREQQQERWYR